MNAEIISVGAELIAGDVSNTNASYLSRRLSRLGIRVTRHTAVDDRPESITEALAAAVARSPIIIFTGGLGPTADDMTKEVVCTAVGMPLVEHAQSMKRLTGYFDAKEEKMPEINRKQALFPKEAIVFPNMVGTADGCAIESGNQCIIMLPGPPKELEAMFEGSVEDYLMGKTDEAVASRTLKVFGIGESKLAELLAPFLQQADPVVATYLGQGDIRIKITSCGETREECDDRCHKTEEAIAEVLGSLVYAKENVSLQETVVGLLQDKGKKIATAESCTAGMLSEMLTDVSGASQVFEFGVSAYANRVKQEVLEVPDSILKKYGAVSPQVAEAMAKGAAGKGKADLGIGITGIAGPTGGTPEKPVGLVYISLYDGTKCFTRKLKCREDSPREKIRLSAVMNALDMVRLYLQQDPKFLGVDHNENQKAARKKKKWWQTLLPMKGDKPAEIVRKVIMLLCLLVFIGSLVYIADYYYQSYLTKHNQGNISNIFHQQAATINERFQELLKVNGDTVGWLTVPGTQCDNPVVQTEDNEKYLDTTFEGKKSKYGTLFADSVCQFDQNGLSDNTIIYGHHMRDGTMFGELKRYREFAFYQEHPVVQFTSLYDAQTVDWKIISVFIVNTKPYDNEDVVFNYRQVGFANELSFLQFVDECRQRSIINTGVDVKYGDKLLTLSTCTYEFSDARLVMIARKVRAGESSEVDLSNTSINGEVVYPKAYYKKTGKSGRTTVRSYVPASSAGTNSSRPTSSTGNSSSRTSSAFSSAPWVNSGSIASGSSVSSDSNMWNSVPSSQDSSTPPVSSIVSSSPASSTPSIEPPVSSGGESSGTGSSASSAASSSDASSADTSAQPSQPTSQPDESSATT